MNRHKKLLLFASVVLLSAGCKKAPEPGTNEMAPPNKTARLTDPLSVVTCDGDAMYIDSFSHLDDVLDSLGNMSDSSLLIWEQGHNFVSLRTNFNAIMDRYEDMPDGDVNGQEIDEGYVKNFWDMVAGEAIINEEESRINLSYQQLGNLVNKDHILYVENSVIYSDANVFICIPVDEMKDLDMYKGSASDFADETHTVYHTQNKSTAACFGPYHYGIGTISCGNPQQKRSLIYMYIDLYHSYAGGGWWHWASMYFPITNQKRGFMGWWYPEKRGTHVNVYATSSYFGMPYESFKVWPNEQTNPVHYMPMYQFSSWQTPQQFANSFNVCFTGWINVAPMCTGNIMSIAL